MNGGEKLAGVAAGEISASYGTGEEGVASEQEGLLRDVEADAAFCVAGGVEDEAGEALSALFGAGADGDDFAFVEGVVGIVDGGCGDAKPLSLNVHHFDLSEVVLVVEDGCAGDLLEAVGSGDVVDVGMGDDDLLDGECVFGEEGEDAKNFVARVDDDCFVRGLVAKDGAVALKRADRKYLVNHGSFRVMEVGAAV
jgi:hypothetical protein